MRFFRFLLALLVGTVALQGSTVTLRVVVPPGTPAGAVLTLGANLNRWDPAEPGFAFKREADGRHVLVLEVPDGTSMEFKITRGSWATVEKAADGAELRNRSHLVQGDAVLTLEVARWADAPGAPARAARTVSGRVERLEGVRSAELGNARDLLVYLPPSYATGAKRYPVLYMHDAQNVFDASTAFVQQEWRADEAAEALARTGRELIIVAVANTPDRMAEYTPFAAPLNGYRPKGEAYTAFLVRTVKPLVDGRFRTLTDPAHTGVLGSSLGGLISLFQALSHPEVFGFAGALSPSLHVADFSALDWARGRTMTRPLRIYLDMGDREAASPGWNLVHVEAVRELGTLLEKQGHTVRVHIAAGGRHTEDAWAQRLPDILAWFLEPAP